MSSKRRHAAREESKGEAGTLQFDVDSALLYQLGEDLVSKRSVAVAELIKNAYDADATEVVVEFKDVRKPGGEIAIQDDGTGISFDRIQSTWMRIATTEKRKNEVSDLYGRPRAGAKGIGRFATRRLALQLVLDTTAWVDAQDESKGKARTVLTADWQLFLPGTDVQSVPITYTREPVPRDTPTGTLLRLRDAIDEWTSADVRELRKDIVKLVSPMPSLSRRRQGARERDPGFDTTFEFPDEDLGEFSGSLAHDFLDHAYAVLEGRVTKAGKATYTLRFSVDAPREDVDELLPEASRFPDIGPTTFQVHYFRYRSENFDGVDLNVRTAQKVGREHGGMQILYDGFRVMPYGDSTDDWLRLDYDRARRITDTPSDVLGIANPDDRPMLLLPGTNQVFGQVYLSRSSNPGIRQLANREGFRENESFEQLRRFVRLGIDWLTVMYARRTEQERRERQQEGTTVQALLQKAKAAIDSLPEEVSAEQRKEASQAIGMAHQAIVEQEAEHIGALQMLRVLASTGTMLAVFEHQLIGTLEGLRDVHRELQALTQTLPESQTARFGAAVSDLSDWLSDAKHQAGLLGLLMGSRARARKRTQLVKPVVKKMSKAFTVYMRDLHIGLTIRVPAALRTPPMYECELSGILINLLTNAMKAVKFAEDRRIEIEAKRGTPGAVIRVKDTGGGAEKSKWKDYFKPFYSESEPDPVLGMGTGLGLTIVSDFLDVYGGSAHFVDPTPPWRTCVEVSIPE